ncbi:cobaltochelatase CobT [Paraburkholderia sp. BL23I1N1]|uniref:cobaltochelatase CobT-related protein n=1 Tax=Paraburkholderia sp. BL23I1N1 TaxID=1938802 RepID=UPI000E733AA5|nr:cobalt chelatase [Paraburkholderia sp. BL23I1N1]RKE39657.1 cobaltochelatase CobT [Paraburkholderia sp. BL23I1N1]
MISEREATPTQAGLDQAAEDQTVPRQAALSQATLRQATTGSATSQQATPGQPTSRQATLRAGQREALCAAAVRALTGDAALQYREGRLCRDLRPVPLHAPHLRTDPQLDDFASLRGAADGAALRLMHSDAALHGRLCPADPIERLVFELLEQLRCETQTPPGMPGLAQNLRERFEAWSRAFYHAGLAEDHLGILLYTVAQIAWSRLTGWPVLEQIEDLIEATRAAIVPVLGVPLAGLRRHRAEQDAFAVHALELARLVAGMIRAARADALDDTQDDPQERDEKTPRTAFSLWFDVEDDEYKDMAVALTGQSRVLEASEQGYRAFTTRYDRELSAGTLVRKALLGEFRERLDERVAAQGINVARLAHALKAALAIPQRDGWSFGEEHGRIDGRRLAQLVSFPAERRLFRLERNTLLADCVVSFLIDCSGSMKAHIEPVAIMVDILTRALDQAGVTTEVLGFTTGAWNGGLARLDWLAQGRPHHPGRLNELSHLVFKDADRSWRRARADIAALFKANLFREGVDGEAVDWACARLVARPEARRILIVISDGSPMDSATGQANDAFYLDNHLKAVVARHEAARDVEVLGLGVGLDLSPYYRRCLAVDLSAPPDMKLFAEIVGWIGARGRGGKG